MPEQPAIHQETHLKVLRLLQANPHMSQRELAAALGVSLGKANFCLRALLDKGLLKVQNFRNSQRKLAYAYLLTPAGLAEKAALTRRFLARKMQEYELLHAEIEALRREAADSGEHTFDRTERKA
jgi:EPS-associated MarR family transcriptional regulator